jgi:glycosyltransferase involved in cell wall biosynthesis
MIKVAVVAPYPASAVLPDKDLKVRFRSPEKKKQHPAPWVLNLCRELSRRRDVEVEVFTHSRAVARIQKAEKEGVHYTFVPKYEPARFDPYHAYLPALVQIRPLIRRYEPDIVHGFGTESAYGLLAISQGRLSVIFIQGILEKLAPFSNLPAIKIAIRKYFERRVINKADGLIAETEFARQWALSRNEEARVKVIPHAYSADFFSAKPHFKGLRIVCIGALSRIKGVTTVLRAFHAGINRAPHLFNKAELVFIGEGALRPVLEEMAEQWQIRDRVSFLGHVEHDKIIQEMEKSNLLVIGSRMDTSPNVITEAHAVGLPVIGTAAGGIPDMIDDGRDGFIVPIDDSEAMALLMEHLLSDPQRCEEMGRAGKKKVRELNDPVQVAEKHVDFYREIIDAHRRAQ